MRELWDQADSKLSEAVCTQFLLLFSGLRIQLVSMRMWIWSLASFSGLRMQCCCKLQHSRCSSDLALLWLWCRPAAAALIQPLAQELPYATGAALVKKKKNVICTHWMWEMPIFLFCCLLLCPSCLIADEWRSVSINSSFFACTHCWKFLYVVK